MRLAFMITALAFGLAACSDTSRYTMPVANGEVPAIYQARQDTGPNGEPITIPAVRAAYLNERNQRQRVPYNGTEAPGSIVVDPYARVLYHVLENGEAMRFGVAVGRAGTGYYGTATIRRKARWPSWRPTDNMIRTQPELYAQFAGGVAGGTENPLGSRALYLYEGDRDTYYRIHGTLDPSSVGKATSAGCIRLFNQDIMDLFDEIPTGTTVRVRSQSESRQMEGPLIETPEGYVLPVAEAAALGYTDSSQPFVTADPTPTATTAAAQIADPYAQQAVAFAPQVSDPFADMTTDTAFVSPVESAVPAR